MCDLVNSSGEPLGSVGRFKGRGEFNSRKMMADSQTKSQSQRCDPNSATLRWGKIVLAQCDGPATPDMGGAFAIKRCSSEERRDRDGEFRHA
jgi:hypothetical protein